MAIDDVAAGFAAVPGATLGRGPHHPAQPDASLTEAVASVFQGIPALERDAGYTEFMWKYAGAGRVSDDDQEMFYVFGFGEFTMDLRKEFDGLIVEDGLVVFAQNLICADGPGGYDSWEHAFAFAVDASRPPGIYRASGTLTSPPLPWTRVAATFEEFLADATTHGLVYPRPDLP